MPGTHQRPGMSWPFSYSPFFWNNTSWSELHSHCLATPWTKSLRPSSTRFLGPWQEMRGWEERANSHSYSSSSFLAFYTLAVVVFPPPRPSLQLQISLDLATAPLLLARATNAGISLILKALRNFDNFCWLSLMLPNHPPHLGASSPCFLKEPWLIEDPTAPNIDQGEKGWSRTNLIFEMIHNSTGLLGIWAGWKLDSITCSESEASTFLIEALLMYNII